MDRKKNENVVENKANAKTMIRFVGWTILFFFSSHHSPFVPMPTPPTVAKREIAHKTLGFVIGNVILGVDK